MRYFIHLAYNGKNYCGWQIQPNAPSVQETIEKSLSTLLRQKTEIVGAGRTDTGVHASGMVAHFDSEQPIADLTELTERLNRILPRDIAIHSIRQVADDLHARFSACTRTYQYFITPLKDVYRGEMLFKYHGTLDFNRMNEAAATLFEYEDFTSFSKLHTDVKTNNCRIEHARWEQEKDTWVFTIKADRFLRNMVRAIVGTLLDVGRGKLTVDEFRKVIESKDRGRAGSSAPAHALFLVAVDYPE